MKRIIYLVVLVSTIQVGCFEDRSIVPSSPETRSTQIRINEVVYTGSDQLNEFGKVSDWVELHIEYAPESTSPIDSVFISDDPQTPKKFGFAGDVLFGSDHLIIWCDDMDTIANQIHTNFKLSASGEEIVLSVLTDSSMKQTDSFAYPTDQEPGLSYGRIPNATGNWMITLSPTPGSSNQ